MVSSTKTRQKMLMFPVQLTLKRGLIQFFPENFFKTISYYNVTIQDVPDAAFRPPDICLNVTVS